MRNKFLSKICDDCLKELYTLVQPKVTWEAFVEENKIYSNCYKEWERYWEAYVNKDKYPEKWEKMKENYPDWEGKSSTECIGPKPFEFYFLPREVMKEVCDDYISGYNLDQQQELLDTIEILKGYCRNPVVEKYIDAHTDENGDYHPGYRDYDHPNNLEKVIEDYIRSKFCFISDNPLEETKIYSKEIQDKFFEFLDMAGNFYNWNRNLNSFNMTVYLGPSPNSNMKAVIENWKKYRGKDIEIDLNIYKDEEED